MADEELTKLGTEPIAGDNPAGEDVQFDDDFDAMRTEIGKLDSLTGEEVSFSAIIENGTTLLAEKSKHFQVAIYLTFALFRRDGYAGLANGLSICHGIMTNFWDTAYPPLKRKRGRIEPFSWLAERAGKHSTNLPMVMGELETLQACDQLMGDCEKFLVEKLENEAPGFGDLRRDVQEKIKQIQRKIKEAEAKKQAKEAAAAAGAPEIESLDDANKAIGQLRQNAKNVAEYFRSQKLEDPVPYRLLRAAYFSTVFTLPPNQDGKTQIPAPQAEVVNALQEATGKGDTKAVIETVENRFATSPFWLDLQRYILTATGSAGAAFADVHEAVAQEVALFLHRQPDIVELSFANGTPFADPETVSLLEGLSTGVEGKERSSSGDKGESSGRLQELLKEARKHATKKLPKAIAILQDGIAQTADAREQFLWRLELAKMCLTGGKVQVAVPQLEALVQTIEDHRLEIWEPNLCREVFSTLYIAQKRLAKVAKPPVPDLAENMRKLHARLCRLDAAAALEVDGQN